MIPLVYLVCRKPACAAIVAPLALVVMVQGALAVKTLRLTALVPAALEELVHFRSALPPGQVIVITRSLLRFFSPGLPVGHAALLNPGFRAHRPV